MDLSGFELFFLLCYSIQFYFWIAVFLRIILPQKKKTPLENSPPISIIICSHNEARNLAALIPKLLSQKYALFEIIVILDRCSDNSLEVLNNNEDPRIKRIDITELPENITGKRQALKKGIEASSYETILVTDADCLPASNQWIQKMVECRINQKGIVLGIGPYLTSKNWFVDLLTQFETTATALQYVGFTLSGNPYMGVGRNMLYSKSLYLNALSPHKHQSTIGGDDDLFINEKGTKKNTTVCLDPSTFCYSQPEESFHSWILQKKRHLSVSKHYNLLSSIKLALLNGSHLGIFLSFFFVIFAPKTPLLIILSLILRTIVIFVIFDSASKKLGGKVNWQSIVPLDFLYPLYLIIVGGASWMTKTVRWR